MAKGLNYTGLSTNGEYIVCYEHIECSQISQIYIKKAFAFMFIELPPDIVLTGES